jgi:hypothetical protein
MCPLFPYAHAHYTKTITWKANKKFQNHSKKAIPTALCSHLIQHDIFSSPPPNHLPLPIAPQKMATKTTPLMNKPNRNHGYASLFKPIISSTYCPTVPHFLVCHLSLQSLSNLFCFWDQLPTQNVSPATHYFKSKTKSCLGKLPIAPPLINRFKRSITRSINRPPNSEMSH